MAVGTKSFTTQFKINAVWTGQKGVAQAQRALGGLNKAAHTANVRMRGMASSVFKGMAAYGVASKAIATFSEAIAKSIEAASEAQKIHDELGLALQRNASRYKNTMGKSVAETTAIIEESTKALIAASEAMEQTGHDAETLQKGFAKMAATGALDPQQILEQRDAFSDVLTYTKGVNASMEDSAEIGGLWADAILRGNIALLKQMDLTTGEIAQFRLIDAQIKKGTISAEAGIKKRQDLMLRFGKKFKGETERAFATPSGKVRQMWIQVENIFENLGKPFIDRAGSMADSFKKIAVEMQPISEKLADIVDVKLKGLGDWLEKNGPEIPERLDKMVTFLATIWDWLDKIRGILQAIEDFQFGGIMKLWDAFNGKVPANRMQQLPGSPAAQINPALQQGKAGQRYQEGIKAEAVQKSTGYAPYQREVQKGGTAAASPASSATPAATAAGVGSISGNLMAKVKEMEGFAKKAEWDYKQWSVGYGTRGAPGQTITEEAAEKALAAELAMHQANVDRAAASVGLNLTPGQRDALTSFDFNTGAAAKLITSSGGNIAEIERRMPSWNKAGGQVHQGLVNRRAKEMAMFRSADAASQVAQQQKKSWYATEEEEKRTGGKGPNYDAPQAKPGPTANISTAGPQGDRQTAGSGERTQQLMDSAMMRSPGGAGGSLKHMIKEMNIQQKTSGATGGQNIAMNAPITVNGVAPGREALMAKKTALALRDPTAQLLTEIKKARSQEQRLGYV